MFRRLPANPLQETNLPNVHEVILSVYKRAVRNCPWSGLLWASYVRAMERADQSYQQCRAILEKGLSAGLAGEDDYFQVFSTFIDLELRRLRSARQMSAEGTSAATSQTEDEEAVTPLREVLQRATSYLTQCD